MIILYPYSHVQRAYGPVERAEKSAFQRECKNYYTAASM